MPDVCVTPGVANTVLAVSLAVLSVFAGMAIGLFVESRKAKKARRR